MNADDSARWDHEMGVPPDEEPLDPCRYSRLKLMGLSPAHYQAATVEETYAMERGSAVHALVLETQEVIPYDKLTKAGKSAPRTGEEFKKFEADHPGALILTAAEYPEACAQADTIRANRTAMRLLEGAREQEFAWSFGKRACAGRPDVVARNFITELKTTASSSPTRFPWQARKLGYYGQLAWYADGLATTGRCAAEQLYIVASESRAPYVVTVFALTPAAVEQGRRSYRLWFEQLLACEAVNEWPGYCQSIVPLDVMDEPDLDFTNVEAA
jgi:hypothetical protein